LARKLKGLIPIDKALAANASSGWLRQWRVTLLETDALNLRSFQDSYHSQPLLSDKANYCNKVLLPNVKSFTQTRPLCWAALSLAQDSGITLLDCKLVQDASL